MMNFFVVTRISNYLDNPRISAFHANMFHGLAERDGKEYPHATRVYANTDSFSSLMISRSGRSVPDICKPSSHLVVNQHYAEQLRNMHNIRVVQVIFKRLVDVAYEIGDISCHLRWGDIDPTELLRTLPDVPEFHNRISHHYEVQASRWRDVVDDDSTYTEVQVRRGTPPFEEVSSIRLSPRMLQDYPVLCYGDVILNEQAFSICDTGIDRDYFIVREYQLPRC